MSGQYARLTVTPSLVYYHVDVFSARPFTGNSLTIFPESSGLSSEQMLRITQEMRHFESIFLCEKESAVDMGPSPLSNHPRNHENGGSQYLSPSAIVLGRGTVNFGMTCVKIR